MRRSAALLLLFLVAAPAAAQESETCTQPAPVCEARAAVFAISRAEGLTASSSESSGSTPVSRNVSSAPRPTTVVQSRTYSGTG